MDLIRLKYKDNQNWATIDGLKVNWSMYNNINKNAIHMQAIGAPEIISDQWNGIPFVVQMTKYESYVLHLYIKETFINEIDRLDAVDIVIIENVSTSEIHTIDRQKGHKLIISEVSQIDTSDNYKVTINYSVNKFVIDKYKYFSSDSWTLTISNLKSGIDSPIDAEYSAMTKTFTTNFEPLFDQIDSNIITIDKSGEKNITSKTIARRNIKAIFFLTKDRANQLKKYIELCNSNYITINTVNYVFLENNIVTLTQIAENLIKAEINSLIESTVNYPLL